MWVIEGPVTGGRHGRVRQKQDMTESVTSETNMLRHVRQHWLPDWHPPYPPATTPRLNRYTELAAGNSRSSVRNLAVCR